MTAAGRKRKIYILLTFSGSLLSRMIKLWTKEPYSHVSVSLDMDLEELYSFGRKHPKNPLFAGFIKEDVLQGTYARFPKTECALYELDIDEVGFKRLTRELDKFKEGQKKYRYNLLGLLGVIVNRPVDREYSYFCSQFVSEVLNNSGIKLIDKPSALIEPRDFRDCRKLRLIYEGNLNSYKNSLILSCR